MELSRRLYTVAGGVTKGNRVADVGTDHGYVPIYLITEGISPSAVAMDVNKGPLERAREHIKSQGLANKIETRLSDGLTGIEPAEVDTVIIAGMGGQLICRILSAGASFLHEGTELVLQPQSEWFKVRRLLHDVGYLIRREWFLKEDGKYYVVIKAAKAKENEKKKETFDKQEQVSHPSCQEEPWNTLFDEYGEILIKEKNPVLKEYLIIEKEKMTKIAAMLERSADGEKKEKGKISENQESRRQRSIELRTKIRQIERALSLF